MKDRQNIDQQYIGGPFDRQVRIEDWDQQTVRKQAVLILGIGGLGSVVASSVLRLGVGKLFMVDYDVVDVHNLNRQILFSHADLGKPKVQAALVNAQFHKNGDTQIQIFHGNALTNWQTIVSFARRSTFVYNCIDWGDKFDMAVCSLCRHLELPLVMGGTFSTSMTIDFFDAKGRPCYLCTESIATPPELWDKVKPEIITQLKDLSFLPKNNNPIGRSSVVVCTICGQLMVAHLLNWMFLSQEKPYKASRLIFYHNTFEIVKFQLESFKKCPYCYSSEQIAQEEKREEEEKKKKQEEKKVEQQKKKLEAEKEENKQNQVQEETKQSVQNVKSKENQEPLKDAEQQRPLEHTADPENNPLK